VRKPGFILGDIIFLNKLVASHQLFGNSGNGENRLTIAKGDSKKSSLEEVELHSSEVEK